MDNLIKKTQKDPTKPHRISDGDGFDDIPLLSYDASENKWVTNESIVNSN